MCNKMKMINDKNSVIIYSWLFQTCVPFSSNEHKEGILNNVSTVYCLKNEIQ